MRAALAHHANTISASAHQAVDTAAATYIAVLRYIGVSCGHNGVVTLRVTCRVVLRSRSVHKIKRDAPPVAHSCKTLPSSGGELPQCPIPAFICPSCRRLLHDGMRQLQLRTHQLGSRNFDLCSTQSAVKLFSSQPGKWLPQSEHLLIREMVNLIPLAGIAVMPLLTTDRLGAFVVHPSLNNVSESVAT